MRTRIRDLLPWWVVLVISACWIAVVFAYAIYEYSLAASPKMQIAVLAGSNKNASADEATQDSRQIPVFFSSDVTHDEAQTLIASKILPELGQLQPENMPTQITWPLEKRKAHRAQELTSLSVSLGLLPPAALLALRTAFLLLPRSKRRRSSGRRRSSSQVAIPSPGQRHQIRRES